MSREVLNQIELLAAGLTAREPAELLVWLADRVRTAVGESQSEPQSMYGAWKGKIPDDVDIEAILREVRNEWEKEWSDDGEFTEGADSGGAK